MLHVKVCVIRLMGNVFLWAMLMPTKLHVQRRYLKLRDSKIVFPIQQRAAKGNSMNHQISLVYVEYLIWSKELLFRRLLLPRPLSNCDATVFVCLRDQYATAFDHSAVTLIPSHLFVPRHYCVSLRFVTQSINFHRTNTLISHQQ